MTRMKGIAFVTFVALALAAYAPEAAANPTGISSCQTITESGAYILTQSVAAIGPAACIVVAADFITLDLDGQVLTGDGTGDGISDNGVQRKGTVVRNGMITKFINGINLGESRNSTIEKVRAIGNAGFGILFSGSSTITGNTASNNGEGMHAIGGSSIITGNIANNNGGDGIVTAGSNTISGNTTNGNRENGIDITCPSNLFDNMARGNAGGNLHTIVLGGACQLSNNLFP